MPIIDRNIPKDWRDLQNSVNRIFMEIGMSSLVNQKVKTPRGTIDIDVLAVDEGSIDKIKYVVECKNWNSKVPQSVVHAFTTVMHETGGNIGFVISKNGFQAGAIRYAKSTNISLLTFEQFENRYLKTWVERHFIDQLHARLDSLFEYTEPINSYRDRRVSCLPKVSQQRFQEVYRKNMLLGTILSMVLVTNKFLPKKDGCEFELASFKSFMASKCPDMIEFKSNDYRGLYDEIHKCGLSMTDEFNEIFGANIFQNRG